MSTRDNEAIWQAQLAEMPWGTIVRFVEQQGYTVEPKAWPVDLIRERAARFAQLLNESRPDRLPPGYPPRAEDDVPGEDRRG